MGLAVLADKTRPIDSKDHVELLHGHILQQHIIGPLQEGGIDRHYRQHSLLGKAACHGDRVALGNAHIEAALREFPGKFRQARAAHHSGGDGTESWFLPGQIAEGLTKGIGKGRQMAAQRGLAALRVKAADAVKDVGILLCRRIALALFCDDVEQHRFLTAFCQPEHIFQPLQIMAVHRAVVFKAHLLKEGRA